MRRLLQFATITFVLVTLLAPLLELFDRWDAAGLSNDTEFACFAVVLLLCLVLLVARAVAVWAERTRLATVRWLKRVSVPLVLCCDQFVSAVAPTGTPPQLPLRI